MSWIAAGVTAATTAYGMYQSNKGDKQADKARAALETDANRDPIPRSHQERLRRLKDREQMGMPGQGAMEERIGASTSEGVTSFKEMGNQANFQDFIAQSIQNEQDQYVNIGIEAARYKLGRAQEVDDALATSAAYEEGQRNKQTSLLEADLASGEAKKGAGTQNIITGLTSAATIAAGASGRNQNGNKNRTMNGEVGSPSDDPYFNP